MWPDSGKDATTYWGKFELQDLNQNRQSEGEAAIGKLALDMMFAQEWKEPRKSVRTSKSETAVRRPGHQY